MLSLQRCPMASPHKEAHFTRFTPFMRRAKTFWVWGQTPSNSGSMMHIPTCIIFVPQAQLQGRKTPSKIMHGNTYFWSHYLSSMTQDTLWSLFWTLKCLIQRGFSNGNQEPHAPCPWTPLLLLSSRKIPQGWKKLRSSLFCAKKPSTCLVSSRLVHPPHTRFCFLLQQNVMGETSNCAYINLA